MTIADLATLAKIAGRSNSNLASICAGLAIMPSGITAPHRLAHYYGQLLHENGAGVHDREIWGPTAAQLRYEGRKDLGNTQPGDGSRFRGRGPIQITGRANYAAFTAWCALSHIDAPDFVVDPEAVVTDPWEGIGPIWYWTTRRLNDLAEANNIETLTRKINGGLNGYADRIRWYTRAGLVLAGFHRDDVEGFQESAGFRRADADGIAGPLTRAALHRRLRLLGEAPAAAPNGAPHAGTARLSAPVLAESGEAPVRPADALSPAALPGWLRKLIG
jgi:putative chitinase